MNQVSPKALLHSKWTKQQVTKKEKHFVVTTVDFDDDKKVVLCVVEAVLTNTEYQINWRDLKRSELWRQGWQ